MILVEANPLLYAGVGEMAEHDGQIPGRLLRDARAQGNLVTDCHLAALAIAHGLQLCTTDGDFAGFEGLRRVNPWRGR